MPVRTTSVTEAGRRRPDGALPRSCAAFRDLRGYRVLDAAFGPGPQLVWGPNAAGKTSLLEAIVLLAWGRSHRTVHGRRAHPLGTAARAHRGARRPDRDAARGPRHGRGRPRRGRDRRRRGSGSASTASRAGPPGWSACCGRSCSRPRRCSSSPGRRRSAGRRSTGWPASGRRPTLRDLATYGRALQQRNGLLRAIREEQAIRDELRFWDQTFLDAGRGRSSPSASGCSTRSPGRSPRRTARSPRGGGAPARSACATRRTRPLQPGSRRGTRWRGASRRPPRRRSGTARRSSGRTATTSCSSWAAGDLAAFASRGQQRTAILAFKLAELDLLTALDGRPPLLLLDDVFSELDPARRATSSAGSRSCPRRSSRRPRSTTSTRRCARVGTAWAVTTEPDGTLPASSATGAIG